jgi:hypothetical protein
MLLILSTMISCEMAHHSDSHHGGSGFNSLETTVRYGLLSDGNESNESFFALVVNEKHFVI